MPPAILPFTSAMGARNLRHHLSAEKYMSQTPLTFIIPQNYAGQRVDKTLEALFPQLSLRARKLLWQDWQITLNGHKVAAGAYVALGDELMAKPKQAPCEQQNTVSSQPQTLQPSFLQAHEDWLFFSKPRGLHSAAVQGGGPSVEGYLLQQQEHYGTLHLCNRLDAQTSGIVVAARSLEGVRHWQDMEERGFCQKRYVALVQGQPYKTRVRVALDTDKRKITRVLSHEAEPLRQSHFFPLQGITAQEYKQLCKFFKEFPASMQENLHLIGCTIYKGARHQIRAHAAYAGFPLWGDARYAERTLVPTECFLLHHGAVHYETGAVLCAAPWQKALHSTQSMESFFR